MAASMILSLRRFFPSDTLVMVILLLLLLLLFLGGVHADGRYGGGFALLPARPGLTLTRLRSVSSMVNCH
jgi:hypothetical protein